jgi:hypothetical protein
VKEYLPILIIAVIIILALTLNSKDKKNPQLVAGAWTIGPIIGGVNYSKNLPLKSNGTLVLDSPEKEPHYVYQSTQLIDKTELVIEVSIQAEPGSIDPVNAGIPYSATPTMSLFIQRAGDDWRTPGYRWFAATVPITSGIHVLRTSLSYSAWQDVLGEGRMIDFSQTLLYPTAVGVMFGGPEGRGHGIVAKKHAVISLRMV